jgi:uncharacterized protein
MNHLESTFTGKNGLWRYLVMLAVIILVANTVGALPLLIGMSLKSLSNPSIFSQFSADPNNYSLLGFNSNTFLVLMLFPFIAGLVAFLLLVKPLHNRTISVTFNGTGKIRWSRFFISALIWAGLSAVYFFVYLKLDPHNFSVNNTSVSVIFLAIISLLLIPFQAAFEEVLFRGYLMQAFSALIKKRWFPLVMTSILFALMHGLNPEVKEYGFLIMMPQYLLFGLIFGIITILDDGIEASIGAHAANNAFLCIMVTNKSSALQTDAVFIQNNIYPWTELIALFVVGVFFIFILKMIFRWKDLSPLFGKIVKPESDAIN